MNSSNTKSNLTAIAFAIGAVVAVIPSSAIAGDQMPTEEVRYGDLNLASEAGVEALDRRLERAVRRVCGEAYRRDIGSQREIAACQKQTWQDIGPSREYAIARATGQRDATEQLAGTTRRNQSVVALSE